MGRSGKREWFVIYAKAQREELAQLHLRLKGFNVFFPRLLLPRSVKKPRQIIPLFPNYIFTRIRMPQDYYYVLLTPGVRQFVAFGGTPMPLADNIVRYLMEQADHEGIIPARSKLKVGQEVRINGGPFEGLIAIIQEPPSARGRVKVLLNLLSRQVKADVPVHFVENEWVASPLTDAPQEIGSHRLGTES
jgi:transcriptional antiterminator RfaH